MSFDELDKMFESARKSPPEPSADFLARVLSDGEALQPAAAGLVQRPAPRRSTMSQLGQVISDAIGGWPAFAGLATAAVTGLWIGISPPESLIAPIGTVFGGDAAALFDALSFGDGFDFTQYEG